MPRYSLRYLLLETCVFALVFATWHWLRVLAFPYSEFSDVGICALVVFGFAAIYGLVGPRGMQVGAIVGFIIAVAGVLLGFAMNMGVDRE